MLLNQQPGLMHSARRTADKPTVLIAFWPIQDLQCHLD
jgi:hypothetical protein